MENKEARKRVFLSFEVTKELREQVTRQAKLKNISRSEYIRNALFEYMSK